MGRMKKYNRVVEYFNDGMGKCNHIVDTQEKILTKVKNEIQTIISKEYKAFTDGLEAEVSGWTSEDYEQFIKMAQQDYRVDSLAILTISTAYARTHKGDKRRVKNDTCKEALLDESLKRINDIIDRMI